MEICALWHSPRVIPDAPYAKLLMARSMRFCYVFSKTFKKKFYQNLLTCVGFSVQGPLNPEFSGWHLPAVNNEHVAVKIRTERYPFCNNSDTKGQ